MSLFTAPFAICLALMLIIIAIFAGLFMYQIAKFVPDAIHVRNSECQNVVVLSTSIGLDKSDLFVNVDGKNRLLIYTSNMNTIKHWARIDPGNIVSMKLGEHVAILCEV